MGLFKKKPELEAPDFPDMSFKPPKPVDSQSSVTQPSSKVPSPQPSVPKQPKASELPKEVPEKPINWADEALGEYKNMFSSESIKRVEDIERQIREIDRKLVSP